MNPAVTIDEQVGGHIRDAIGIGDLPVGVENGVEVVAVVMQPLGKQARSPAHNEAIVRLTIASLTQTRITAFGSYNLSGFFIGTK